MTDGRLSASRPFETAGLRWARKLKRSKRGVEMSKHRSPGSPKSLCRSLKVGWLLKRTTLTGGFTSMMRNYKMSYRMRRRLLHSGTL